MLPMMGDTTTAIVWGIPVNPADFLCNLDAFRKAIPTIHTLRLCHQFGKGENVRIADLPKELVDFIEEELLVLLRQEERHADRSWIKRFCCFEGTCRPSDHMDDVGFPSEAETYADMVEDALTTLSKTHPGWRLEDWFIDDVFDLPEDVQKLVDAEIAAEFDNYGDEIVWQYCFDTRNDWPQDVRSHMDPEGNNDVLRKYFGLNAFIMEENLDDATIEYLQRTDERYSYSMFEPEKATICYLTLPPQTAKWDVRLDRDCDDFYGDSASSMMIDRNSLDLTEEHQRLFARVMSRLALKPSVHPSQLRATLSATPAVASSLLTRASLSATNRDTSAKEETRKDAKMTKRVKALNESQWPKLMCLVNTNCRPH